ncbi:hypothetical protein KKC22_03325 [Myxococcota bacterium]|nr:hypothetical protein [Myxococcota bacterium]
MLEVFGYLASAVTVASLMMSNIWRLRWLNLAGALSLMVYSLFLRAWPLVAVNGVIAVVDAYHLWTLAGRKDTFGLAHVCGHDEAFLRPFLEMYREDIARFFPGFDLAAIGNPQCVFILRNLMPVGLFVYAAEGEGVARIHLDYVSPAYRDLANARFFYNQAWPEFLNEGFRELVVRDATPVHAGYCRRMGFGASLSDPAVLVRTVSVGKN